MSKGEKRVSTLPGQAVAPPGEFVSGESISDAVGAEGVDDIEEHFRDELEKLQVAGRKAEELSQHITLR